MGSFADRIGDWELGDELGRGSFGRVFRVREVTTGATRALKLMDGAADPERIARFEREAQSLARLGGKGVIGIHKLGEERGRFFFVMDLAPGGSLRHRMNAPGGVPWREAVAIAAKVARTLDRCAGLGLVHRDVKPENILFDERGEPLLVDFGCVRDLDATRLTETGTAAGSPAYMSFEQLQGKPVGSPADVYGLGTVLHELLQGEKPRSGKTLFEILKQARAAPPRLDRAGADWPPELAEIVRGALAPDPARRPTAGALADALAAVAAGERAPPKPSAPRALLLAGLALLGAGAFLVAALRYEPRGHLPVALPAKPEVHGPVSIDDAALASRVAVSAAEAKRALGEAAREADGRDMALPLTRAAVEDRLAKAGFLLTVEAARPYQEFLDVAVPARRLGIRVPEEERQIFLASLALAADAHDVDDPIWLEYMTTAFEELGPDEFIVGHAARRVEKQRSAAGALAFARRLVAVKPDSERLQVAFSDALDRVHGGLADTTAKLAERRGAFNALCGAFRPPTTNADAWECVATFYWLARHLAAMGEDEAARPWLDAVEAAHVELPRARLLRAYLEAKQRRDPTDILADEQRRLEESMTSENRARVEEHLKDLKRHIERWQKHPDPDALW